MPELEGLRRRMQERVAEAKAMVTTATAEERELSAEEVTKFDALMDEADRLETVEIPAAQTRADRLARLDGVVNAPVRVPTRPEIEARLPQTPRLYGSLGEQVQAITRAFQPGGQVDPRLLQIQAATGMNEGNFGDGGFAVQTDFATTIMEKVHQTGLLMGRCASQEIGPNSNGVSIPRVNESSRANGSRWGGVRGYWAGEAVTLTASQTAGAALRLDLTKVTALVYSTDELVQDATALESYIMRTAPNELAFKVDDGILNGTGAGMPQGIIGASCTVSVAKESGQAADTIVKENIDKMWSRMWAPSRGNAVWLINQDCEPQLDNLAAVVGVGGVPAYLPPGGLSESPYARLKGRQVLPVEQAATIGDTGDIMLVDLSQYLLIRKGGVQTAVSIHVQFTAGEVVYRFVLRINGQPAWSAALTPFKSSLTLSPFVKIDAR